MNPRSKSDEFSEPFGKELLTASEVAKFLRVKPGTVVNWGRKGWLTQVAHVNGVKYIGTEVTELGRQRTTSHDQY